MKDEIKEILHMTAESVGKDLLGALIQEIKLLPDVWQKISKKKQDDVIDRLRSRVEHNVKMAVHLIASEGRTVVAGDLEQITIKDGIKAVVKFGCNAANLHELYDAANRAVLVVVANHQDHTDGMDEVEGESDQRAMDLGHEYDPDGDGKGMEDSGVVDADYQESPQLEHKPTKKELDQAFQDGYEAAEAGHPESECPVMRGELCIQWVKGWKSFHAEHPQDENEEA